MRPRRVRGGGDREKNRRQAPVSLTPEQLRTLQFTELELLGEADRICRKYGIPYVIIAGTLLGAVRHRGFIPWDDDADIALFRGDYERFVQACRRELDPSRFAFQDDVRTPGYRWGYGKLRRKDTLFLRAGQEHMPYFQGVFLDVFPLDPVPKSKAGRAFWNLACFAVRKLLWAGAGKVSAKNAALRAWYRLLDRIPERRAKAVYHRLISRSRKYGDSGFVRILTFPTPNAAYGYRTDWYRHRRIYEFEGRPFYGIRDAEAYLTFKYGDYRRLPPPGQRKTHPVSRLRLLPDAVPESCRAFAQALFTGPVHIFGTGYTAGVLWRALERNGMTDRIEGFVETAPERKTFCGRPVQALRDYTARPAAQRGVLLLAVHEAVAAKLTEDRVLEGRNVLPVTDVLPDLLYGEPLARDAVLSPAGILRRQPPGRYWIAARLAGLRALRFGDPLGASVYQKALRLFCGEKTAAARLERFARLADDIERNGFDPERPILLDEDGRVIDGLHRLALAVVRGEPALHCRIYARSALYGEVLDERNFLTAAQFDAAGFTAAERELLEDCMQRLRAFCREEADGTERAPEISVILPVYNVAEYLDACMESVLAQTFSDFEVLLIDDGSTDGSGARCDAYAERDARVRVFHKENGGVSSARNLGIERARGRFLAFADPDDWLDVTYLEKLHTAAITAGADFAECDLWRVDGRSGKKIFRSCCGTLGVPWTREEHMIYGPTATYKAISRRSLWMDNGVRLPNCAFESPAVYALVLALAEKTVNVPEALYYYRRFRPDSLIETGYAKKDGSPNNTLGVEAMEHLLGEFRRLGLYERYRSVLERVVKYRLSDILAMQFHRKRPEDLAQTAANFRAFLQKTWPGTRNLRYITWGGYNLSRILVHLPVLHEPQLRFGFSSLVSLTGTGGARAVRHKNRYRGMMLQREETRAFLDCLEAVRPAVLFIDLMEERFDLWEREGRFVTASDARDGAEERETGRRIDRTGPEADALFAQACTHLSERLAAVSPDTRVVLLENYLCERTGDLQEKQAFPEAEAVRADNALLARRYTQFAAAFPEALRIRTDTLAAVADADLYFTDKNYEYGAVPSHLNELANRRIAEEIRKRLQL